jgi:SAM-dependent methyltransferase
MMRCEDFLCLDCRRGSLQLDSNALCCEECHRVYPLESDVPLLFPPSKISAVVDGAELDLASVRAKYDLAYKEGGLMGTEVDREYDEATKRALLAYGQPMGGKRILDLGTGVGRLWDFVPGDAQGYALDLSPVGAAAAFRRRPSLVVSASVGEFLPYRDEFFDVVVAADTLEHAFDPRKVLAEVRRVLKPGGVFAASLPVPDSLKRWGVNLVKGRRYNPMLLIKLVWALTRRMWLFGTTTFQPIDRDLDASEWTASIRDAGFRIESLSEWPLPPQMSLVYLLKAHRE